MLPRQHKNHPWRSGYTTGACAAAAAKAATLSFLEQRKVERVQIELPQGKRTEFRIETCVFDQNRAT
ncbi:MAG: cobalt-precorrin-5B (C(1))-methyltransferase, partial [Chloroflexi bacterium]|nr:cobalt-precorrin-5B (C(1))-methyltransferase [Chloroflexota bacterium]